MKPLELEYESICTACGGRLKKSELSFAELDLKPYHKDMNSCNVKHPNSYQNYTKRNGRLINMLSVRQAQTEFRKRRVDSLALKNPEKVMQLLEQPSSFRLATVESAAYLVQVAEEKGFTITEAFRWIITDHADRLGEYRAETTQTPEMEELALDPEPEQEPEERVFDAPVEKDIDPSEDDLETF